MSDITVTDLFCGAGGSSTGAVNAGANVRMALNHWKLAIETHNTNHPDTDHDCTDIQACDPRRYPRTTILIASPECTNHSLAKGVKRPTRQISLLDNGQPDPSAERSRATMWDVVRFTEHHQYKVVIVENVPDARSWILYDAWLKAMHDLGYAHKEVFLNSMFVWPTPQSRDRMYVVFWRKGNRAPVLDYHPVARCEKCVTNVRAVQVWKNPAKPFGKYKAQYRYLCPQCASAVQPFYFCAANAIDWSLPITRIADRKRPLKEKTMARIRYGLEKYANHPFAPNALLMMNYSPGYCKPVTEPTGAITTSDHHSLLIPMGYTHEAHDRRSTTSGEPLPTQSTRQELGLCIPPFMVSPNHSDLRATNVLDAMPTQTAGWNRGLVMPFITSYYGNDTTNHQSDALGTVTTRDRHAVVVPPFTVSYYGGDGDHRTNDLGKALPTVPGMAVHYLAQPQTPSVDDCGFRMLQPHEVGAAMAFPREYVVLGNAREQVKQYGNAVTPPVMQWLVGQVMASLS
ncbi:DNA cytosine methyltransferase [Herpetosiphon geysericola]|uniref:DNA (cytosine-5-)-methyltransferase n=1 Tax=Herpetosiphon geysericola TaxID=70996 RepID=A0A0P6YDY1_9CHLR|nr:DNA cytosine methyltransferase [Herpetosiphon geysericola]KPL80240.1 hypothetical protein SE18_24610 [Herpetosiphon geysericola]